MIQRILTTVVAILLATQAIASDVYLEQAGGSSTIDITQTGDGNRVGSSSEASTLKGGSADVDITQTGSSNEIDIEQAGSVTSGSDIDLTQTGSNNIVDIDTSSAEDLIVSVTQTGDDNEVNVCGTITAGTLSSGVVTDGSCASEMTQADFAADISVTGDGNNVNVGRSGVAGTSGTTEVTVDIGSTTASNYNVVNIDQSDTSQSGLVDLTVDGDSNVVNITQD